MSPSTTWRSAALRARGSRCSPVPDRLARWWALLCGAVLLVLMAPASAATYTFRSDSYSWESAATTLTWARACTAYPGDDDQATVTFTGGFTFTFGGIKYSSMRVLANGALQFGADTGFMRTYTNTALPAGTAGARSGCTAAATARTIMVYWTDLNPSAAGSGGVSWEQKGTAPNRYVVVSWNNVFQYGTSTPYTFQVLLYESGEFKFQYGNDNASGSSATIGVQVSASDYTQYSYNSGYNANGSAIRWFVGSDSPTRVAEYRFDEFSWKGTLGEVRDSSGNGRNGVLVGGGRSVGNGYICRALESPLNTTTETAAIDTLVSPTATLGSSGGITLWVRSNVDWTDSRPAMLLDASAASSKSFFLMRDGGGAIRFYLSDSGSGALTAKTANNTFTAGTWVHLAVSWRLASGNNQSAVRIYVNGVLSATAIGTTTGTLNATLRSMFVGDGRGTNTSNGATPNSANGSLDELRLYNYEIGLSDIAIDRAQSHDCLPPVDHYEISMPSTTLACLGSTVTVIACADSSSPCTNGSTGVQGQTALLTASGSAALGSPLLSFDASGKASTTVSFPLATEGTVVKVTLSSEQTAALYPRQCCPDGTACSASDACATTFATAGFAIAATAGGAAATLSAQTAGTASATHYLRAVRSGTDTKACEAALTGAQTIDWSAQCNNPSTCSSGNRMTITGSSAATVPGHAATGSPSYGSVAMSFDSGGNAPFTFSYADVGQVSLVMRKQGAGLQTSPLEGRSNAYVTRPAGFSIGSVRQTASPNRANPGATDANGGLFVAAGEAFSATVTAIDSNGAATPNFGRESTPQGVTLQATLLQPAGGAAGALSGGSIAGGSFSAGVATVSTLSYSEVGIISLRASASGGSYLGAGAVDGTATGAIGRFVPARFAVTGASLRPRSALSCAATPSFGYLGENFQLSLTLSALNSAGNVTQNYSGSFAKLNPTSGSAWSLSGVAGTTSFTTASGRLALGSATGAWAAGVAANVTLTAQATRASAPDGPHAAAFGVAPVDSDGVALTGHDLDVDASISGNDRTRVGSLALRFGRLRLHSAAGAADRPLSLPVVAEHWNGSAFETNTLDDCTPLPATITNFGNLRRSLTTADTAVAAAPTLTAGRGSLRLAAPGGGRSGTVDVALSLGTTATDASCLQPWTPGSGDAATTGANLSYLRGAWCGSTWSQDPAARASFGLPRSVDTWVYRRENY